MMVPPLVIPSGMKVLFLRLTQVVLRCVSGQERSLITGHKKFNHRRAVFFSSLGRCRSKPIKETFIISYGSEDGSEATFPLSSRQAKTIKPLSTARERTINLADVKKLQEEYDSAVIQAFEHVTIRLH